MITKINIEDRKNQIQMISIDELVPQDHLLRKIDKYIDFDFIYDLVEDGVLLKCHTARLKDLEGEMDKVKNPVV